MRACIFCGAMHKKLTAEHLFGDWISWAFDPARKSKKYELWHRNETSGKRWKSASIDFKAALLCNVCNNEWFSELENLHVKPVLEPILLTGKPTVFSVEDQVALSAWIFRTMVVFNHMWDKPKNHFYSAAKRKAFRDTLEPPDGVQIWLFRYIGRTAEESGPGVGKLLGYDPRVRNDMRHVRHFVFTFTIRQFAVQLLAIKRLHRKAPPMDQLMDFFQPHPMWQNASIRICPNPGRPLAWPPPISLIRSSYEDLVNRFGGLELPLSGPSF